jgi:branched-chain amino acid transport system permease protein
VTQLLQQVVDGLGRGSEYALIGLGIAVIFGVMHLVNFAHGELITVSSYAALASFNLGASWWVAIPVIIASATVTSIVIELVAFRRVRGASDFTMLLTSFGVHFVVAAVFVMYVSANTQPFDRPDWIANTFQIGSIRFEVFDVVTIGVTAVALVATLLLLQRTMFGVALRAAAEDFDAARLMGVRSDRVIQGAFVLAGVLAGIASIFVLMRTGRAAPALGLTPMLKGVLAALIGGLGSLQGAVLGGFLLGLAEVLLISRLPEGWEGTTNGVVFLLIALLFVFRPGGLISAVSTERV